MSADSVAAVSSAPSRTQERAPICSRSIRKDSPSQNAHGFALVDDATTRTDLHLSTTQQRARICTCRRRNSAHGFARRDLAVRVPFGEFRMAIAVRCHCHRSSDVAHRMLSIRTVYHSTQRQIQNARTPLPTRAEREVRTYRKGAAVGNFDADDRRRISET